jgi:CubicO group peptidase (beta-lactamase class C family)
VAATEDSCQYERRKSGAPSSAAARWREGVIRGEVHDQNAWAAGGVAGHAGLFGTSRDVYRMAREAIAADLRVLRGRETRMLTTPQTSAEGDARSLAYRINRTSTGEPDKESAAGVALPAEAFGHNGFTGTSVWIDPRAPRVYVLLTNRVHPAVREDLDMNALRREFHRLAAGA